MDHTLDSLIDSDKCFLIDPVTRTITNQTSAKNSIIQYDHNSEVFRFRIPKLVENHDMSNCDAIEIHFINKGQSDSKPGIYKVTDVQVWSNMSMDGNPNNDTDDVEFSWLISQNATQLTGEISFQIKFICYSEEDPSLIDYIWSTKVFSAINVLPGINNADIVVETYSDILREWELRLFSLSEEGVENINTVKTLALEEMQTAKTETLVEINTSIEYACEAVEEKGKNVLETIPDDYADLSNDLKNIKNDLYGETEESDTNCLLDGGIELFPEDGIYTSSLTIYKQNGVFRPRSGLIEISGEPITVRILSYRDNGVTAQGNTTGLSVVLLDADKNPLKSLGQLKFYGISTDGTVIESISLAGGWVYPSNNLYYIEQAQTNESVAIRDVFINGGIVTIASEELDGAKYIDFHGLRDGQEISIKVWQGDNTTENDTLPSGLVYDVEQLKQQATEFGEQMEDISGRVELLEIPDEYNILEGNEALIATVFGESAGGVAAKQATDFAAIALADLHKEFVSIDDAVRVKNTIVRPSGTPSPVILTVGDNLKTKPRVDGVLSDDIIDYMDKAIEYGIYHTLGNHDVGGTYNKNECLTHEEVFNTYISPMKDKWGLPDLDTIYYFKDFPNTRTGKGTRLISLYQYDIPLVDDETDVTKYKYSRVTPFFGQAQLNWLVDTLASTPDNYRVIIMMHEQVTTTIASESIFNDSRRANIGTSPIYNKSPIMNIVQAYIDRTTLNTTYTPINTTKYPDQNFVITVNADFSNAKGEFAHYLTGHIHYDFIGLINNIQRHIVLTASCGQSEDCHIRLNAGNASRSLVNLFGYDYKSNFLRLGRVGQQYSLLGQARILERVTLTKPDQNE